MKKVFWILIEIFFVLQVRAQEKVQFSSINLIGILAGGSGQGAAVQTTNGICYKHWNAGIGTGIDWYGVRSIPLVADIRRSFTNKKCKPFVYGNAGVNFPWENGYGYNVGFSSVETTYKNGFCGEMGLGYKVSLKNHAAIVVSAGFSYKEIKGEQISSSGIPGFEKTTSLYDYYYRRIAIRMGFSF
ncbi:MAG: hypothetical protein ABIX01_05690 [Chitinophagaceae bacterium]